MEWIYLLIPAAILFGIPCALIASSKNKKVGEAFLLGVFFGIFALIYYIFCKKEDSTQETNNSKNTNAFYCEECGTKVSSDSEFCPKCGIQFEDETIKCKKCKTINHPENEYCIKCGNLLRDIYVCDICEEEFSTKKDAEIHEKKCREKLEEREYKWFCEKCGKSFKDKDKAIEHEKKCKK